MTLAQPSLMSLLLQMSVNGNPLATGTGFVAQSLRGPVLITCRHNLTGRNQLTGQPLSKTGGMPDTVTIIHNVQKQVGRWTPVNERLYEGGVPRWKEHPRLGANADLVALPLSQLNNIDLYPYDVANPGPGISVGPAAIVSVIGFPFGVTAGGVLPIWVTGFMASGPDVDYGELPCFLIDCRSRQGQSGSPVIAYRDRGVVSTETASLFIGTGPVLRFLGMYSGRINSESHIGVVWKVSAIQELVASI